MDTKTKDFVRELLAHCSYDREKLARYMRDTLHLGGIRTCRALIEEALKEEV